jgi:hypothetical protein
MQPFQPRFDNLQKDIERYLTSAGKYSKTPEGMIMFRDYEDTLKILFDRYIQHRAFAPLVSHFRSWNWEYTYNTFLVELTDALRADGDWPQLKRLWDGVVAKRRKLYNDLLKLRKRDPRAVTRESLVQARDRLVETLGRVREMSVQHGTVEDTDQYSRLVEKAAADRLV